MSLEVLGLLGGGLRGLLREIRSFLLLGVDVDSRVEMCFGLDT